MSVFLEKTGLNQSRNELASCPYPCKTIQISSISQWGSCDKKYLAFFVVEILRFIIH